MREKDRNSLWLVTQRVIPHWSCLPHPLKLLPITQILLVVSHLFLTQQLILTLLWVGWLTPPSWRRGCEERFIDAYPSTSLCSLWLISNKNIITNPKYWLMEIWKWMNLVWPERVALVKALCFHLAFQFSNSIINVFFLFASNWCFSIIVN